MTNELKFESSLYLKQHQDNPVNWYPWGKVAFELAKRENKPIFLSIGYSACHWCHVMAHDCFEDAEVANLMNHYFINIKVDKEERPDIDQIYQRTHYIFTQRPGGWPLSVFMTPNQEPYYIGTYIPKLPKYNLPGMTQLIPRLAEFYSEEKETLTKQTKQIRKIIESMRPSKVDSLSINKAIINKAMQSMMSNFDNENGGFGQAPKFPNEPMLSFIMEQETQEVKYLVSRTLEKMLEGGLFDHVEGGFFRYCVDATWTIPHYEKMLYNSAQLVSLYSDAYISTNKIEYKIAVKKTINWLMHDMQSDTGGFFSSLDADSLNQKDSLEEGVFYNWTSAELRSVLTLSDYKKLTTFFNLEGVPNYEGMAWHLNLKKVSSISDYQSITEKLKKVRIKRSKPGCDKKVITSWNALFIKSLLNAGEVFKEAKWVSVAQHSLDFISKHLYANEQLSSIYYDDKPKFNGYLDDYAYLLDALIDSIQINYREKDLIFAIEIGKIIIKKFQSKNGGYFFTSNDHESLFDRQMIAEDNATPSSNGIVCLCMQKLSQITLNPLFAESGYKALLNWDKEVNQNPQSYPSLLKAYHYYNNPKSIVFIIGNKKELLSWKKIIHKELEKHTLIVYLDKENKLSLLLKNRSYSNGGVAYVCKEYTCIPVIYEATKLLTSFKSSV